MNSSRHHSTWWKMILVVAAMSFALTQSAWAADPVKLWGPEGIKIDCSQSISDGLGGLILICGASLTPGGTKGVIFQRIDSNGIALWGEEGVFHPFDDTLEGIVSDMTGGIIFIFRDIHLGMELYAQRIDATGIKRWGDNGVPVVTGCRELECGQRGFYQMISDGAGGAIIVWAEGVASVLPQIPSIWAQRIDTRGVSLWTLNGVPIKTHLSRFTPKAIISDGKGGAIVAWEEEPNLLAQRIDENGAIQWHPDGNIVATESYPYVFEDVSMVEDGLGGTILAWAEYDNRSSSIYDVYGQKVSAEGITQWEERVMMVADAPHSPISMIADGNGGAIFNYNYHIQRLTPSGTLPWGPEGFFIDTQGTFPPVGMVSDGAGGTIVVWHTVEEVWSPWHQYWYISKAQRLNPDGAPLWTEGGFEISRTEYSYSWAVTDGYGGIVTDGGCNYGVGVWDCYAQRINDHLSSLPTPTLLVKTIGTGNGAVSSNPVGMECGVECFGAFNVGAHIVLTPIAATGSVFLGWDGEFDCADGIVTINENMVCTARFEPEGMTFKPPQITIDSECYFFGLLIPGGEPDAHKFNIQNTGEQILFVNKITTSPPFHWDWGTCREGEPLSPGESCNVSVVFLPEDFEPYRSTLQILSNDPETPVATVHLSGGLLIAEFPQAISNWNISKPSKIRGTGSFALDPSGYPHLSYLDESDPLNYVLKHVFFDGKSWHRETVDTGNVQGPNIAVDSLGHIHIIYGTDHPTYGLKYAHFDGTTWTITSLENNAGYCSSITVDNNNNPHISHINRASELRYTRYNGAQWISETVSSNALGSTSIAVDSTGNVHILSADSSIPRRLIWVNNLSGVWEVQPIGEAEAGGFSIALDSFGNPHIVYSVGGEIKYARYLGLAWETQTIITSCDFGGTGDAPDLALDANDRPHISFRYSIPALGDYWFSTIIYAKFNGEHWVQGMTEIDYKKYYTNPSIALDPGGTPHIVYAEGVSKKEQDIYTLKYVYLSGNDLTLIKKGNGAGVVMSSPPGINCGPVCKYSFEPGIQLTLTALPDPDSGFAGWVGCPNPSGNTCSLLLTDHIKVTALFSKFTLKVGKTGVNKATGTIISTDGKIDCGTDCVESYPAGTTVSLKAVPNPDSGFVGWTGCTSDPLDPAQCTVVLDKNITVKAIFSKSTLKVKKASVNKGTGTVVSSDGKISCGIDCSESYPTGATITLTAQPDAGSTFLTWSGACSGTSPECIVTLGRNTSVTAKFAK